MHLFMQYRSKNPPDTDPRLSVGAYVGKLYLGVGDGGSGPGGSPRIGEIGPTSRL